MDTADNPVAERPEEKLIARLSESLSHYLEPQQVNDCIRAYQFGAVAHQGQFRRSGEAYICHPLSVALILADMHMDANAIMAAILHDVLEDCHISKQELAERFNNEVAELVDGVTKLTKIASRTQAETQAENVRKMLLAMDKDLRVILVKLADRLHNVQTLGSMPPEKKRRIAQETLEIYAPIANRLGMNKIRHQLENLCFQAMYPYRYAVINNALKKARGNRKEVIDTIEHSIKNRLEESLLSCKVSGREKNIYSIYQKMLRKKSSLSAIFDVYAFRIFCNDVDTCYRALGVAHTLYKPIPGRFKDYIALPKANGYQSLHTHLIGPYGLPIEIQIRTYEMHNMSESGIAAHWLYKTDIDKTEKIQARANEWLKDILEMQKLAGDSLEFIDNLKVDLFPHEVFVFTPKGQIVKIARGATVVDFAYAVHTDVGNSCISAMIDKQLVPLHTKLENGVTVEIITAPWARPNPMWLNSVTTVKARSSIRNFLKNFKQQEAVSLGRRLLENELQRFELHLNDIEADRLEILLKSTKVASLDALLEDIGLGNKMPFLIAKRLAQDDVSANVKLHDEEDDLKKPLIIRGTEGMVVTLAKCCRPIPGDSIIGFFNPGKGIVVHHHACRNRTIVRKRHSNWLDVEWCTEVTGDFPAELRLEILNQRGALATIASTISDSESNIENVTVIDQDMNICVDLITLTAKNRVHLAQIIRRLKELPMVLKITRVKA